MGEAQWFQPTVRNRLEVAVRIANFTLAWGKCYDIYHPYEEVGSPDGTVIDPKKDFTFGTCGRANASSGTEGSFDLVIDSTSEKIAEIYFDCPWGIGTNLVKTNGPVAPDYLVAINAFNQTSSGPLGTGTITVISDALLALSKE